MHVVESNFRFDDQFRGSSGSSEGAGTRTISRWPLELCFASIVPSRSTRWTVPGICSAFSMALWFSQLIDSRRILVFAFGWFYYLDRRIVCISDNFAMDSTDREVYSCRYAAKLHEHACCIASKALPQRHHDNKDSESTRSQAFGYCSRCCSDY